LHGAGFSSKIVPDPVSCEAEKVHRPFAQPQEQSCGVLSRDGVFYAKLKLLGQEDSCEIALHGVNSELEARLALASLASLRATECALAAV
jgi:hypothetical protein